MSNTQEKPPKKSRLFRHWTIGKPEKLHPEDSILLRVLVQTLVIVGILAVDIAAETPWEDIPISLWAIPFSIVGAVVSWYRRKDRNIALKFLLAIGMIWAMFYFFGNLFGQFINSTQGNDTRIILAQLLIQLQVLHSFDLPTRKDLGYSMVIGLILLGVAGTISQTLTFAPVLIVFLAIGLPVLVLDYRSRIGLILQQKNLKKELKILLPDRPAQKKLGLLFAGILTLGLAIFAVMPRFPGYQLQTFPVTAPSNMQNNKEMQDFQGGDRSVKGPPGYVKEGKNKGNKNGNQQDGTEESFYYGFDTKINQNRKGQPLKEKVLMRVRSQAEGFWRVVAFDKYTGQGWEVSRENNTATINRPRWSYRFFLPGLPNSNIKSKEIIQTYTMVSDMQGLIPGLTYPKDLYFPTEKLAIDAEGTIRTPGYLPEGLTYTLISQVPYRNESLLGKINPQYNQKTLSYYLQVPENITEKVRKKTEEILAKSEKPLTTPYWKAKYLAQYLKQHFRLPEKATGEPLIGEDEDLVEAFLFQNEGGYTDHFATTLTIMLRSIGIPARLVAGFSPGQFNPFTGLYIVKNTNAYTMTEVYFGQSYGWFAFDPIPTHPLIPPSIEDDQTFSVLREFWKLIAGILPTPISSWFNAIFGELMNWIGIAIIWLWSVLSNGWSGFFASIILAIVVGFIGWILWTQWQKFSNYLWLKKLPPMEGIYQQMLILLKEQGFPKHPAQTPYEYARNSRQQYEPEIADLISSISQHYEKWRYGGKQPNFEDLKQQLRMLKKNLSVLAKIRKPLR